MKHVRNYLILLVVLAAAVSVAFLASQTAAVSQEIQVHDHTTRNANVIDGSLHPELIQDKDAYRLFFLVAASGPAATTDEINHQRAVLAPAGLSDTELLSANITLTDFKMQYEQAVQKYNASAEAAHANNTEADVKPFLAERDALVQLVRFRLGTALSPESVVRLDRHVQHEKSKMKVAKEAQ
jgi:hypothetical protein